MIERNKKYSVLLSSNARKMLDRVGEDMRSKLMESMKSLEEDPLSGKALAGPLKGFYSIRVWPFRIVYQIAKGQLIVYVISIGHRKEVYK